MQTDHQAIAAFANKVGAFLSRHFGEAHRGDHPDVDELFDMCEDFSWIACQKIEQEDSHGATAGRAEQGDGRVADPEAR